VAVGPQLSTIVGTDVLMRMVDNAFAGHRAFYEFIAPLHGRIPKPNFPTAGWRPNSPDQRSLPRWFSEIRDAYE
jgi:hypothetical protein